MPIVERQRALRSDYGIPRGSVARIMSPTECAWLGGLFDGEGTITLSAKKHRDSQQVRIGIRMVCRDVIERVQEVTDVGGITLVRESARAGYNRRDQWNWCAYGMNAALILEQIFPWLIEKKEKAAEAIMVYDLLPAWKSLKGGE